MRAHRYRISRHGAKRAPLESVPIYPPRGSTVEGADKHRCEHSAACSTRSLAGLNPHLLLIHHSHHPIPPKATVLPKASAACRITYLSRPDPSRTPDYLSTGDDPTDSSPIRHRKKRPTIPLRILCDVATAFNGTRPPCSLLTIFIVHIE